jgi:antitoxin component of MazEF toxin-antitoxin module
MKHVMQHLQLNASNTICPNCSGRSIVCRCNRRNSWNNSSKTPTELNVLGN